MILGLTGHARAGKDTVAAIVKELRRSYTEMKFAQPIRDALYALNPMIPTITHLGSAGLPDYIPLREVIDDLGWDAAKDYYPEIRPLMYRLGTEVARKQWSPNFWIYQLENKLELDRDYVISDVRFLNEAQHLRDLQEWYAGRTIIVRIVRPGQPEQDVELEQDLIRVDHTIVNDGTKEELYAKVSRFIETAGV